MKLDPDGIVQVAVTGQSGDGGIDGKGIVKIQEVLSLHVVFQCKRYKGLSGPVPTTIVPASHDLG
ncbi:restriction endonuclease [Maridesulfovibrio sp.]|uniref:restriction endonuclease n=1 Tax=Maridesulfovibrio sp. TaxID=2795000 RepID=UPI0039EF3C33